jgi:hypothetical protein
LTVSGTGFDREIDVTVYLNNVEMAIETADKYGSFEVTFEVPPLESGTYVIEAEDDEGNKDDAAFTVTAGASLSQSSGVVGTLLMVNGVGFKGGAIVTVDYDDIEVATAIPSGNGAFSAAFNVPPSTGGNHVVVITDGTNAVNVTFTMELEAPPVPELLLPAGNSRAEADTYFDWEDVDDPSGVTYTLQVATKRSFASPSVVLEEAELIDSEYTVTEEQRLEPSSKEAPHYWRVKAVDGASNGGEWSEPRSFYVGSSFTLPTNARNALIGIGIGGAVFFGFWLGRRTAYSRQR